MVANINKIKRVRPKKKSVKSSAINIGSKRKLDRFGKKLKKGRTGELAQYITRGQALRKLQLSLMDFRKLCILKGIYPRDPKKKSMGHDKTYYHVKDILFLLHEPLLNKFREMRILMTKIKKVSSKGRVDEAKEKYDTIEDYSLDHIVRERYPTFQDALEDMDDALTLVYLFASLPSEKSIHAKQTIESQVICKEWEYYISTFRKLKKSFISIKGIYYRAEIQGVPITWLVPHEFSPFIPEEIDLKVMNTFLSFYLVFMKFTLFKLYTTENLSYPPIINQKLNSQGDHLNSVEVQKNKQSDDEEEEEVEAEEVGAEKEFMGK